MNFRVVSNDSSYSGNGTSGGAGGSGTPPPPPGRLCQVVDRFEVPPRFELWADGLYKWIDKRPDDPTPPSIEQTPPTSRLMKLERVAGAPLWIGRLGITREGDDLFELVFLHPPTGQRRHIWVTGYQITSKSHLGPLATNGIPVNDLNANDLIRYLDMGRNQSRLEVVELLSRTGYHEVDTPTGHAIGWLLNDTWYGPSGLNVAADPRSKVGFMRGFCTRGSQEAADAMWEKVRHYGPFARFLLYSVFAAPLLRPLRQRTFFIHHHSITGSGKTALARMAMSAFGDPGKLSMHFNRTEKAFAETFAHMTDVPVLFDELQAHDGDASKLIYDLCLEKGRGRSGQVGKLIGEDGDEWRALIRTTGEEPIVGRDTRDLGGQRNRVLQISDAVLKPEQASEIHQWLDQDHYGWGAQRFLTRLQERVNTPGGIDQLDERFKRCRTMIRQALPLLIAPRVAQLAIVALAQALAYEWFYDLSLAHAERVALCDAAVVGEHCMEREDRQTLAEQALLALRDHATNKATQWPQVRQADFRQRVEAGTMDTVGVWAEEEVWIVPASARTYLELQGFRTSVWDEIAEYGLLSLPEGRGHLTIVRKHGHFRQRVYAIPYGNPPGSRAPFENPFAQQGE